MRQRSPVIVVVGTRPEAVKMAPVVHRLRASRRLAPVLLATSQHTGLLHPVLREFGLVADHDLRVMRPGQTLASLSSRLMTRVSRFLEEHPAAALLVQGDTTSALVAGLCAFYHGIAVGHVEAGLRTHNLASPFPEELNRKLLSSLARWHFAPTDLAVRHLRREGVRKACIHRTGNTVVDAMRWMLPRCPSDTVGRLVGKAQGRGRLVLVTCHRREHFGAPMRSLAEGLRCLAQRHPEVTFLFPMHSNPEVRQAMRPRLAGLRNLVLRRPLGYGEFLACLKAADLVLTDSGGVQEEATVLGKPVVVLREETERWEGVRLGWLTLAGSGGETMVAVCERWLQRLDRRGGRRGRGGRQVFGDGQAADRIVAVLEEALPVRMKALPRARGAGTKGALRRR